jgi:hypothetical protein
MLFILGPSCPDAHPKIFNDLDEKFLKNIDKILNIVQLNYRELKVIRCENPICKEIGHKTP